MPTSYEYISRKIEEAKSLFPDLRNEQNHRVFSLLCMRYFFYDIEEDFSVDDCLDAIVDGANDGGIDAIFSEEDDDVSNIVVIQSKYYDDSTKISKEDVINAVAKILRSLNDLKKGKYSNYNEDLKRRYASLVEDSEGKISPRIFFFTSYDPSNANLIRTIERAVRQEFKDRDLNIEIKFGKDICQQIENLQQAKTCVDKGRISIDERNNVLRYRDDAIIVNVSARSLANLYNLYGNALLGLNLRYYIRNKNVDSGIDNTIADERDEFWYRNNGITVICDDYKIDGKEIHLSSFSIINGGQTTYRISKADCEDDFYLLCKIVKRRGDSQDEKDNFVVNISRATNAQKPVKLSDLMANAPEQLKLKTALHKLSICYITKRGEKYKKKQFKQYQVTTIQKFGKISLAATRQQPGKARSSQKEIFKEETYKRLFLNPNVKLIADLLRIEYYYDQYKKTARKDKNFSPKIKSIISNGTTYQLAAITYLFALHTKRLSLEEAFLYEDEPEKLSNLICKSLQGDWSLFCNQLAEQEEMDAFFKLFNLLSHGVMREAYDAYKDAHPDSDIPVSNFLKTDKIYTNNILHRLTNSYTNPSESMKGILDVLCGV